MTCAMYLTDGTYGSIARYFLLGSIYAISFTMEATRGELPPPPSVDMVSLLDNIHAILRTAESQARYDSKQAKYDKRQPGGDGLKP